MPSGYKVNGTDLDSIFKPRYSTKRADVGFKISSGSDISNLYEKTSVSADQINYNTGYQNNGQDLRYLFAFKDYVRLRFTISSTAETYSRYDTNDDGILKVTITNSTYNPPGNRSYKVVVGTIEKTSINSTSDDIDLVFTSLNQDTYSVTVTETVSGKTLTVTGGITLGASSTSYDVI